MDEYDDFSGDICWDDPRLYEKAPNLAYTGTSDLGDNLPDEGTENPIEDGRTFASENLNAIIDVIGKGNVSGYGPGEDIVNVLKGLLAPEAGYHFEFRFWKVK